MDVVAMFLHASSQTSTIVIIAPSNVLKSLKYGGVMTTSSGLATITIASSFRVGEIDNWIVIVIGFKILAKIIFVARVQTTTL